MIANGIRHLRQKASGSFTSRLQTLTRLKRHSLGELLGIGIGIGIGNRIALRPLEYQSVRTWRSKSRCQGPSGCSADVFGMGGEIAPSAGSSTAA